MPEYCYAVLFEPDEDGGLCCVFVPRCFEIITEGHVFRTGHCPGRIRHAAAEGGWQRDILSGRPPGASELEPLGAWMGIIACRVIFVLR